MALTFIRIEHSVKFKTMKEATREADTLRMNIIRYCKRVKIPCTAMIGISEINIRNAEVVLVKNGKCRPARKIVSKVKRAAKPEKIQPHLHIILLCPSGYTKLSKYLITRIQERFKSSTPDWHIYADDIEQRGYNDSADYYTINDPLYYIKLAYLKRDIINTKLCADSDTKENEENIFILNDDGTPQEIW